MPVKRKSSRNAPKLTRNVKINQRRSKRVSQKKRGRKMSRRQRGGNGEKEYITFSEKYNYHPTKNSKQPDDLQSLKTIDNFKPFVERFWNTPTVRTLITKLLTILFDGKNSGYPFEDNRFHWLNEFAAKVSIPKKYLDEGTNHDDTKNTMWFLVYTHKIPCEYLQRKINKIYGMYTNTSGGGDKGNIKEGAAKIMTYIRRIRRGKHEIYKDADENPIPINCETKEHGK